MASSKLRPSADQRVMPALATSNIGVLPMDALYEIFFQLPAKDLCRLRVVCRQWRFLLSDSKFIEAHGARHMRPLIIARYMDNAEHDILVDIMDMSGQIIKKVRHQKEGDMVVSMILDLVCVKNSNSGEYRLLNPATNAVYHLPQNVAAEERSDYQDGVYGFGKVASTGEYKVFRVLESKRGNLYEVCTLNNGSHSCWKAKQGPSASFSVDDTNMVVIDGVVFFLTDIACSAAIDQSIIAHEWIVSFDLKEEKWKPNIRGPSTFVVLDDPGLKLLTLANLNGSLVIVYGTGSFFELWVLMDIQKGIWVKQYSLRVEHDTHGFFKRPLLLLDDGKLVMHDGDIVQIYDQRANTITNVFDLTHYYFGARRYTGNLLSLDSQKR